MERKRKIYTILTLVFAALLLVWGCGAAILSSRVPVDRSFLVRFFALLLGTLSAEIFCSIRAGKLNAAAGRVPAKPRVDRAERKQHTRTNLLFFLGAVLSYGTTLFGIVMLRHAEEARWPVFVCLGLLLLCAGLNPYLVKVRMRRLSRRQQEEGNGFLLAGKENAASVAAEKLRLLRRLRIGAWVYALALLLTALVGCYLLGRLHGESKIWLWWFFAFFAGAAMARIPLTPVPRGLPAPERRLEPDEFPQLWRLLQQAASAVGYRDTLLLSTAGASDVAVMSRSGGCLVSFGMDTLFTLTEEELYQGLLCALAPWTDTQAVRARRYTAWLQNGRDAHSLAPLCAYVFQLPDTEYEFQYQLYCYAADLCEWDTTLQVIRPLAEPKTAVSALLRKRCYEYWLWEQEACDRPPLESYAAYLHHLQWEHPEAFRRDLPARLGFWSSLIEKEFVPADWPDKPLREQIEDFGISQAELLPYEISPAYRDELLRVTERFDDRQAREHHETMQTEAQASIDQWEAEGRPLRPQSFGTVISALRVRGRIHEALALCDRAIDELPSSASIDYPCFFKGCWLLHAFDARGLRFIYRAMEGNGNYVDEGLSTIAGFCRMSGDREAMRQYEERAPELRRRHEEEDSEMAVLRRTDDLRGETLPEELKASLLQEILRVGGSEIRRIFLLHKTITPTRFTSAMIVQFEPETPQERRREIMNIIFNLLDDSTNWQFSLFDYEAVLPVQVETIAGSLFYEKTDTTEG